MMLDTPVASAVELVAETGISIRWLGLGPAPGPSNLPILLQLLGSR